MTRLTRAKLILLAVFAVAYAGLMMVVAQELDGHARREAERQVLESLLVHKAVHGYVTATLRPEIFRLQKQGLLADDYFTAKLMSFTFIARNIQELLNQQRRAHHVPETYFKLATDNPRNPVNQADAAESELLRQMNAGRIAEYRRVVDIDGHRFLYLALPVDRTDRSCMRCHGKPEAAPRELVRVYGDQRGFGEDLGQIRALISIRVPFDAFEDKARQTLLTVAAAAFLVLSMIYAMIAFFLTRLDAQQQLIVEKNLQLEQQSATDPLTGAYNRRGFLRRLDEEIVRAERLDVPLCLMLLDVDHFKRVNDRHGHQAGDELLVALAQKVSGAVRGSDIFARWGGEEFILVVPHEKLDNAERIAEKLRLEVAAAPLVAGIALTVSLGVAGFRRGETAAELIARADKALYAAKAGGRNRSVVAPAAATG